MSTPEDIRQDAKRDAYHDWLEAVTPVKCSQCGTEDSGAWILLGTDPAYGADADGRRGMTGREWECRCGNIVLVVG